jgi:hypothetical protein
MFRDPDAPPPAGTKPAEPSKQLKAKKVNKNDPETEQNA